MSDGQKACLRADRADDTRLAFAPLPGLPTRLPKTVLANRIHP